MLDELNVDNYGICSWFCIIKCECGGVAVFFSHTWENLSTPVYSVTKKYIIGVDFNLFF